MSSKPYHILRFRRALIHFVTGRVAQAAARAILVLVLVRLLPIADYGVYMLLVGLAEMLLQVGSFGILPVGRRYLPQMLTTLPAKKLYRFVLTLIVLQIVSVCAIAFGLSAAWEAVTPWLGFSQEQIEVGRPAVLLFLLIPAFRFCSELLEALLEQGKSQLARALMPTGRVLGVVVLLVLGVEVELASILFVDIGVTAGCLLLAWGLLRISLKKLHAADGHGDIPYSEITRFAWHMAAADLLSSTAAPGAIRLVLASTLGVVGAGLFAFLQSLERLVARYLPGVLLSGIIRPILISRAFTPGGISIVRAGSGLLFKSNLLIVAAGTIVIAVAGDPLVAWASGGKFVDAGFTLLLMFLALGIQAQRSVIEMVMQITGHTSTLRATALIAPLTLAGIWLFADQGLNVAILILAAGSVASNGIAALVLSRSVEEFRFDWRGLGAVYLPVAVAIPAGLLLAQLMHPYAAAVLAVAIYVGSIPLAKPFASDELALVERAAGGRIAGIGRIARAISQRAPLDKTVPGPTGSG
jgi:O-antigen/teichoic acid export membrane protein